MSKSSPNGAIFLKDTSEDVEGKIKRAKTATTGETNDALESHFTLCKHLCRDEKQTEQLERYRTAHMSGEAVMGDFKKFMAELVNTFPQDFQENYATITPTDVQNVLDEGGQKAHDQATSVLKRAKRAMGLIV